MSETINNTVSQRICQHMNDDHSDAIVLYAQFFSNIEQVQSAKMISIDSQGMDLWVQTPETEVTTRIKFEHSLANAEEAHHTLIAMLKQARKNSG
jgi:putative heme iron utilization protein